VPARAGRVTDFVMMQTIFAAVIGMAATAVVVKILTVIATIALALTRCSQTSILRTAQTLANANMLTGRVMHSVMMQTISVIVIGMVVIVVELITIISIVIPVSVWIPVS